MKGLRKLLQGFIFAGFVLIQAGLSIAEELKAPPAPQKPLSKESTVPCFVPGTTAPENYLKRGMKGFGAVNHLFSLELTKGSDALKFLSGGIFDFKMEVFFQEPALTNAEREKNKEKAPNKDNLWKLPSGAQAWDDITPQYVFYLKAQSFDPHCAGAAGLKFRVLVTKQGKEKPFVAQTVVWKESGDKGTVIGGGAPGAAKPGFSISFNPTNTLYKNEGILYSGVPLSADIDQVTVEATNCFNQTMLYTYHMRNGQVPQYVETRDQNSGMFSGKLVWETK